MKRFIVFKSKDYYPWGGAKDMLGYFDELPNVPLDYGEWANALDTQTNEILWVKNGVWAPYPFLQHEMVL